MFVISFNKFHNLPRLRTQWFRSENLTFSYDVSVDKEGNFTTTLPEDIVAKLTKIDILLNRNRLGKDGFFSALSLKELQDEVENTVRKYSEKKLIEEKVIIRYAIDTVCHYCKGKDGTIYPDGGWQMDVEGEYDWEGGTKEQFSNDCAPYGFEVYLELKKVKVWEFPDGEIKKEYIRLEDSDYENDELMHWLDSIVRMGSNNSSIKEIDYSPQVGLFFKNLILYICNMNEKIKEIFGEEVDLSKISLDRLNANSMLGVEDKRTK